MITAIIHERMKYLNTLAVLEDAETYSGYENATIQVWPNDDKLLDDDVEQLNNGVLPDREPDHSIQLKKLLQEALAANLPCVSNLREFLLSQENQKDCDRYREANEA